MSSPVQSSEKIRVECAECGAAFRVAAAKAGKRGPCPKCGQPIVIPHAEVPDESDDDGYSLADDLPEMSAPPPPVAMASNDGPPRRPAAGGTPRERAAAKAAWATAAEPSAAVAAGRQTGRFALGAGLAGVVAVVGCALWIAVWHFASVQLGILAWGLGLAIGGAMFVGYGDRTVPAGLAAGAIALAAVFMTKALPAAYVASTIDDALAGEVHAPYTPETARADLPSYLINDYIHAAGLDYDTTTEEQHALYHAKAQADVAAMDEATLELTYKRQQVADCLVAEQWDLAYADAGEDEDVEVDIDHAALAGQIATMDAAACDARIAACEPAESAALSASSLGLGFWAMFGYLVSPWDALWTILAVGSAYKISGL